MTIEEKKSGGYITLKEASELFGYSPDYIGQLIRKGKIEGKQVYANVAWMTTRETLEEYLLREKKDFKLDETPIVDRTFRVLLSNQSVQLTTWLLRVLIPVLVVVLLIIFYFLSISIEHWLILKSERDFNAHKPQLTVAGVLPSISIEHFTYEK